MTDSVCVMEGRQRDRAFNPRYVGDYRGLIVHLLYIGNVPPLQP